MPYAEIKGLNLYYEEFGRGETVLFLHSHFNRGLLAFSGQILPFSGRYRCLYPDLKSTGLISLAIAVVPMSAVTWRQNIRIK